MSDPEWNGRADPKWSGDGTMVVYTEELTIAPACGGENPLPCFKSELQLVCSPFHEAREVLRNKWPAPWLAHDVVEHPLDGVSG